MAVPALAAAAWLACSAAAAQAPSMPERGDDAGVAADAAPDGNIRWPAPARDPRAPALPAQAPMPRSADVTPEPASGNVRWPDEAAERVPVPAGRRSGDDGVATHGDEFDRALAIYTQGTDPRRYEDAAALFLTAALQGDRRASLAFGYLQGMGLGVERDRAAAALRLAADSDAGWPRADYLLSLLGDSSRDAGARAREAELREAAARRGDPAAQNAMGVRYQLAGDRATAEMWFQRAAANGSPAARSNLANLARTDSAKQAGQSMRKAADTGNAAALFALARRFHRGDGEHTDYAQALRYYRAAAAKGHIPAQRMLGLIQSRPAPGGEVDPAWMSQLANADVGAGPSLSASVPFLQGVAPALDDPLSGLATMPLR